jgi:hypothetical protein
MDSKYRRPFVLDVYACAAYITSCIAKSSQGMSEILQTACKEAKLGQRNFKQQLRHINWQQIYFSLPPADQLPTTFSGLAFFPLWCLHMSTVSL